MKYIYTLIACCCIYMGRAQTLSNVTELAIVEERVDESLDIYLNDLPESAFSAEISDEPDGNSLSYISGLAPEADTDFEPDDYTFGLGMTALPTFMFNDNLPVHLESEYLIGYVLPPPYAMPEMSAPLEIPRKDFKLSHLLISSGLMLTSGFCDATSEVLKVKYDRFKKVFPESNDQFWDYSISWTNKYKEGNPPDARFPGSKNLFVWTTDGYHLMRMIRNSTMVVAMTIPIRGGLYKNWRYYVLEGMVYYISYTAGFNLAYDVVFN